MTLRDRISSFFATPQIAQLSADCGPVSYYGRGGGYDAARDNPSRSALCFPMQPKREFNPWDRKRILEKLRALEANLGLVPRMKGQVRKYSVGAGIFPIPQTTSAPWNVESRTKFIDWANNPGVCDAAGAMTFWERQGYHAETFFAEHESFDALISSSVAGAPQLQLFDSTEIGGGYGIPARAGFTDGVRANAQNRPLEYEVVTVDELGRPATMVVAANDMIHLVRRKRPGQLRAISPFAPAINPAIDVMDLDAVVTQSAKLHNALGISVNKKSGDAGKTGVTNKLEKQLGPTGKVTEVREDFIRGAIIQYLGMDEEMKIVSSDRPTENLLNFLVYRIRNICLTSGLPFEIVWDMSTLGGATARIALQDAQFFFDGIQDFLNDRFNQRVWVWWCASMMASGQLSVCEDPRWWNCHWQGPAKLTADEGYSAQAQVERLYTGQDNWTESYARRGRAWKPAVQTRIDELAWLNAECALKGVDPNLIFPPKPGTAPQPTTQEAA